MLGQSRQSASVSMIEASRRSFTAASRIVSRPIYAIQEETLEAQKKVVFRYNLNRHYQSESSVTRASASATLRAIFSFFPEPACRTLPPALILSETVHMWKAKR